MLMLANYISTLESDKQKLKAQVKRLCSENNWLRKELTDHQQLLQETEIALAKVKEEKENVEFLLDHHKKDGRREREQSPAMDVDDQEEETEGGSILVLLVCLCVWVCVHAKFSGYTNTSSKRQLLFKYAKLVIS
jgi:kinesin light chain